MPYKDLEKYKEYHKQYQKIWIARNRAEYFTDKICVRCSSKDRLELDHVDPSTKVHHNIWSWSIKRRLEELAKCQILCYDCHRLKTNQEISNKL